MPVVIAFLLGCLITGLILRRQNARAVRLAAASAASAERAVGELASIVAALRADARAAAAARLATPPPPTGRAAVLASFHSALLQLEQRRAEPAPVSEPVSLSKPVPQDRVPASWPATP